MNRMVRMMTGTLVALVVAVQVSHAGEMIRKRPDLDPDTVAKARELAAARERILQSPTASEKSTLDLAKEMAQASRKQLVTRQPEVKTPQELRKDGVYLLLTFALPDDTLKEYFRQAHTYGIRICLRGLVDQSFKKTRDRIMHLFLDEGQQPVQSALAGIVIDPVIFRRAGVTEVPALVVSQNEHYLSVTGLSSVKHLMSLLAKEDPGLSPVLQWMEQRDHGFVQGGPTSAAMPALPVMASNHQIKSEFPTTAIREADMLQLFKDKIAATDWGAVQKKGQELVKRKVEAGPGLQAPRATQSRRFTVDLTTEFPEDVRDPSSNTLLIKGGSRVNPLAQGQWPYTMVVFNANDDAQVKWVKQYLSQHRPETVKLSVTEGNIEPLMTRLDHRVYWMSEQLMNRFQIAALPSTVRQVGAVMEVQEYVVR